ncbi:MAG TPA: SAVED domain-containing protein [Candidatus Gastranaerophilales bacterium]|nr:SAVED domain-containing protein [Candidatus Gastranaerophilales bacterium]
MSNSEIPTNIRMLLWGKSAGRCQYEGCNKPLWIDDLTKNEFNIAYHSHIIADSPNGPRGDAESSELLCKDISNIILLCDEHHRLVDKHDVTGHPPERLFEMKRKHEQRIELVTSLLPENQSHVLMYGANIGQQNPNVNWNKVISALSPSWYPAEKPAIELSLKNSSFRDSSQNYWLIEKEHLTKQYEDLIKPKILKGDINHFSIFALAPQPLLIYLGKLLMDIHPAEVYQLHREPQNWLWQNAPENFKFIVQKPGQIYQKVALNLSLSATINNSRIQEVLGDDVSIWTMTIENPYNDFLKSSEQLSLFRDEFKKLVNLIKAAHGENTMINLFPAVPVAVAVEIGRIWMSKADLPFRLYDQNKDCGGFVYAFDITPSLSITCKA